MIINWNPEVYGIGLQAMDDEHKVLVGLINALDQHKQSADRSHLANILKTLEHYTKNHFAHEEQIMSRMGYNRFDLHRQQHLNFIRTIQEIEKKFAQQKQPEELMNKTLQFLREWLTQHILVEDRAYVEFLTK